MEIWCAGEAKANDAVYRLPFRTGEIHRVNQGALGKFSHYAGTGNEQAIDWEAAEGTIICAARAGVVTGVRDNLTVGGTDPALKTAANFVILRHDDGTYAEYLHLQPQGALVRLGDKVAEGQPIAKSGNTGYSEGPHIHFAVFRPIDGETRLCLAVKFQTRLGVLSELKSGETY